MLGGLRQLPIAQRFQQIPGESAAARAAGPALFFEEVGALLQGLPSIAAKAGAQSLAAADQLLIQPGRADDAGLPFNRQMRFQFDRHAAQPLRVVLAATLGQVVRHLP